MNEHIYFCRHRFKSQKKNYFRYQNYLLIKTFGLTLGLNEGMVQISTQQWIRKLPQIFLKQRRYIVWTLILFKRGFSSRIETFSQLELKSFQTYSLYGRIQILTSLILFLEVLTLKMPKVRSPFFSMCLIQAVRIWGMVRSSSAVILSGISAVELQEILSRSPGTLPAILSWPMRLSQELPCGNFSI